MKCLLYNFQSNESGEVKKHCLDFHNVDQNNQFFVKLFKKQNSVFHGKKCLRCNKFLPSYHFKANHDFLVHYDAGRNVFQEKPVNYANFGEIRKYEITFDQHSFDYDFFNAEKLVKDSLLNVKNKLGRSDNFIKCGFSLENIQPFPVENKQPIKHFRYWSTEPYQTKSFNDFVYFNLRETKLIRIINNGFTGSS